MSPPLNSRFALLQELMEGPGYGLALIQRIAARSDGHVQLNRGGAYVMLSKMEEAGLIRSHEREEMAGVRRGGKPKRWYEITKQGRAEYERTRKALGSFSKGEDR